MMLRHHMPGPNMAEIPTLFDALRERGSSTPYV